MTRKYRKAQIKVEAVCQCGCNTPFTYERSTQARKYIDATHRMIAYMRRHNPQLDVMTAQGAPVDTGVPVLARGDTCLKCKNRALDDGPCFVCTAMTRELPKPKEPGILQRLDYQVRDKLGRD
jgi:hypothetical protein